MPFTLVAPDTLDGLARSDVAARRTTGRAVTYGQGLGRSWSSTSSADEGRRDGGPARLSCPTVSIGGATGHELVTTLGTRRRASTQGGVVFTVAGSVTQADAEAAARALAS